MGFECDVSGLFRILITDNNSNSSNSSQIKGLAGCSPKTCLFKSSLTHLFKLSLTHLSYCDVEFMKGQTIYLLDLIHWCIHKIY